MSLQCLLVPHTIYCNLILNTDTRRGAVRCPHHDIAPRLKTHHKLPKTPKLVRMTTGNVTWNTAPGRAFNTRNGVTATNATHTQIHACHHDIPNWIIDDTIIQLEGDVSNAKGFIFFRSRE